MGRLDNVLFIFNSLTGQNKQHNRALRDVTEWSSTIQDLLTEYGLQEEGFTLDTLSKDIGKVRFELIGITYRAHGITRIARKIKGANVLPLVNELIDELEEFGRELINPSLNQPRLIKTIPELRNASLKLKDVISEIEYK